jgi:YaiO family outer membrane protein
MKYILLILLVGMACLSPAQDLQDVQGVRKQAQTAVSEKRYSDALPLYRTLLSANPADVDDMLWIARLLAWTGDHTGAADYYSQALTLDPNNVDAMVGKANVLMWQGAYQDALVLLTAARQLAPSNPDVELAWSRYFHWQGNDREAKLHVEKCLAVDGGNQEALELEKTLIPDHIVEFRIAYEGDTLPGTTPGAIEQLGASYFSRRGDVGVDFFHMSRFGESGSRGGLRFGRKFENLFSLRAAALFGGGGDIVPKQDFSAGISSTAMHGVVLGADYRYIAFPALKVYAAIGEMDYYFEKPMWILTSVAANRVEGATTPAFLARFNSRVAKNWIVQAGYGHGTEVFQLALPTDFGAFRRDSYIGGMTFAFTKKTRTEATYTLARRSTGVFENMFLLTLVHTL